MSEDTKSLETILTQVQEVLEEVYIFCYILNVEPELPVEPEVKDLPVDEKVIAFITTNLTSCKDLLVKCEDRLRVVREEANGDRY